ncbi:MAG: ankyrin repeat domain-containing protein, partial [Sedimentisphaerales bacterium]
GANINSLSSDSGSSARTPLHEAAIAGHRNVAEILLSHGARIDAFDNLCSTPLHCAAEHGHKDVASLLIDRGLDVNAKTVDGYTPLHLACQQGKRDVAEFLMEKGANPKARDIFMMTPLHFAVDKGFKEISQLLIDKGADVNAKNKNGKTPLDLAISRNRSAIAKLLIEKGATISNIHTAAFAGDLKKFRGFVEAGADVNSRDETGMTPLLRAVSGRYANMAKFLIKNGADVNTADKRGFVPLVYALWNTDPNVVKMLLDNGADVNVKDTAMGYTALHWAVLMENKESTQLILTAGADVNVKSNAGETPLDVAAYGVPTAIGELLIANGAEISSLHAAAYLGDMGKVKSFIDGGADVNQKKGTVRGTALHSAAVAGRREIVEFLISKGADVNAQNRGGQTPLHIAAEKGHLEVVRLLIDSGAEVNASGVNGQTPLYSAAAGGRTEVAELLISKGADANAKNSRGVTPSGLANQRGHTELSDLLDKYARESRVENFDLPKPPLRKSDRFRNVADFVITGESGGRQQLGNYIFNGDVNGDGYQDLLITASNYDNRRGRAYIYYGGPTVDAIADKIFTGENPGDLFGEGSFLSDLNNDGYSDLIVGSLGYNDRTGKVYIYYGGKDMDTEPDISFEGELPRSSFGRRIGTGDINGDGFEDLFVTALWFDNLRGRVYLFYGGHPFDTEPDKRFDGDSVDSTFGFFLSARGDVDGDGCNDLLVGTPYWPDSRTKRGRAYLYFGGPGHAMDNEVDVVFTGEHDGDDFGAAIDLYDIDNDGHADVMIGARKWPFGKLQGRAYIYWGSDRATFDNIPDVTIDGHKGVQESFGGNMFYAGDINGDEYGDFIVGAYDYCAASRKG